MNIYIASDHGGFELKDKLKKDPIIMANQLRDLGPEEFYPEDDYPDYAIKVAEAVARDGMDEKFEHKSFGILICRSGNGMVIGANKVKGCYAALCFTAEHARKARQHDNANILCLDSDYEGEDPSEILKAFLEAKFEGKESRHGRRFEKVLGIERNS